LEKSVEHIIPYELPKRKIHFISFANDDSRYKNSLERILKEAKDMNYFDTVTGYTEKSPELQDFFNKHKTFFSTNKRGYGYWIWKPYIVSLKLKEVNNNDVVLYVDSGCELNKEGIERLKQYTELARINDLVAFKLPFKEYEWTKGDILKELDCYSESCYDTYQTMACTFLTRKCDRMIKFFDKINELCEKNSYHLVDDSPSKIANITGFRENRHDQSLFSVLIKTALKDKVMLLENETDPLSGKISEGGYFTFEGKQYPFPIKAARR
jgi:hypothetical protein